MCYSVRMVMARHLGVIVPSVRGMGAVPIIENTLKQEGFDSVNIVVGGKSCSDKAFVERCTNLSPGVVTAEPFDSDHVPPGMARNRCLAVLEKRFPKTTHVLFLDDDIVVPGDYASTLADFLEKEKGMAAVMGRVISIPRTYWTRVIDYSNFWWLQTERDIVDLGWVGAGATLTFFEKIHGMTFDESMTVNEDIDFFQRVAKIHNGTLGIHAGTTCEHHHARSTFKEFVRYQFNNGKQGTQQFHSPRVSPRSLLIGLRNMLVFLKKTLVTNGRYLIKRPHLIFGISLGILIYETGIQAGIHHRHKNKKR
jgi:hypothetical protein